MARKHRLVVPDFPHHVIQRGNRRQRVFFSDEDRRFYLSLLKKHGDLLGLCFWAYCLMDNHVHLVVAPKTPESLPRAMSAIHWRYTLSINLREDWKGSLWQGRYRSYPMNEQYAVAAIRYIELNPVRAGIVARAENYQWSSAKAHIDGRPDPIIVKCYLSDRIADWASFLAEGSSESELRLLREHASTCRPLGDQSFIKSLEKVAGTNIAPQRPGPKPKTARPTGNPAGGASMKKWREFR
jgi:putative transposase